MMSFVLRIYVISFIFRVLVFLFVYQNRWINLLFLILDEHVFHESPFPIIAFATILRHSFQPNQAFYFHNLCHYRYRGLPPFILSNMNLSQATEVKTKHYKCLRVTTDSEEIDILSKS